MVPEYGCAFHEVRSMEASYARNSALMAAQLRPRRGDVDDFR
ncbi:hypothetical protein I546_5339 [Mycobacterium kansasii 732]|nr:hypothetical protein I546_5339 [Mycobacterium kansasii 732]